MFPCLVIAGHTTLGMEHVAGENADGAAGQGTSRPAVGMDRPRMLSGCKKFSGCAAEVRTLGIGTASDLRVTGRALFPDSVESHGGIGEELTLGGGGTWEVVRLGGTAQAPPHETGGTRSKDQLSSYIRKLLSVK